MADAARADTVLIDLTDFLPQGLVTPSARVEVIERLSRLPVEASLRYAVLCGWERAVGLTVDRWEIELVVLGWRSLHRAAPRL